MILYREVEPSNLEVAKQSFCPEAELSDGPDLRAEVTIHYAGGEGDRAYISFELLKRRDLMGCATRKTRPRTRWVLKTGARVEAALAYERRREIAHREMTLCGMVCDATTCSPFVRRFVGGSRAHPLNGETVLDPCSRPPTSRPWTWARSTPTYPDRLCSSSPALKPCERTSASLPRIVARHGRAWREPVGQVRNGHR